MKSTCELHWLTFLVWPIHHLLVHKYPLAKKRSRLKYPRCSTFFCMVIFQVFRAFLFCASARRKCVVECWKSTPSFRTTDAWLRPRRASQSPSLISWAPRKQKDYGGPRKSAGKILAGKPGNGTLCRKIADLCFVHKTLRFPGGAPFFQCLLPLG